ncbi:hypothetical protein [Methylocapsa aurea]|uniref:hypothetical protein n=1 Tax=Methylocapsa aurea TaxID=663610 RepID=UPI003D18FBBB
MIEHPTGGFTDEAYLVDIISSGTNFPPASAGVRVDSVVAQMKDANDARKLGVYLGFLSASTLRRRRRERLGRRASRRSSSRSEHESPQARDAGAIGERLRSQ